jgi:Arfaptin-like domain
LLILLYFYFIDGHNSSLSARAKNDTNTTSSSFNSPSSPFDSLRTWSSSALLYARQYVSEHLSRGNGSSTTGDPETVARVSALREQQRYYARLLRIATTLTGQLEQIVRTQRALGGAFGELSQCGGDVALGEQFACSTDVMRLMSKQGDALLGDLFFLFMVTALEATCLLLCLITLV